MADIEIPDDVYQALDVPESDRDALITTELAVALYDRGVLSIGKARQLADHSPQEFHRLLGDRQIERHYTTDELDEDLDFARE